MEQFLISAIKIKNNMMNPEKDDGTLIDNMK